MVNNQTALNWFLDQLPERIQIALINTCGDVVEQAREMDREQLEKAVDDALLMYGIDKTKSAGTRVKVTWIAILDGKPIVSAGTSEDLRKGLDEYYAVDRTDAKCLGFVHYDSKYPDEYEGHYSYSYTMILRDVKHTEIDTVKVYCVDYYPKTTYNIL